MGKINLVCERCNNQTTFTEETTVVWVVDSNGNRERKRSEVTKFVCERCKRKVVPWGKVIEM
jgi:hypothetical protein